MDAWVGAIMCISLSRIQGRRGYAPSRLLIRTMNHGFGPKFLKCDGISSETIC